MAPRQAVLVLGGGFGGLRAALDLSRGLRRLRLRDRYEVTLIDRNPFHTFTPLLYEIATTGGDSEDAVALRSLVSHPFADILAGTGVSFRQGSVTAIDVAGRNVAVDGHPLRFDYLIVATGSEPAFFDIPGLAEHAYVLKSLDDALRIRDAIASRWNSATDEDIDIVVAGGGPTGVELASELRVWTEDLRTRGNRGPEVHIRLVERMPEILRGFAPAMVARAVRRLGNLSIEIRTGTAVSSVSADGVTFGNGETVPADVCVWTGGVRGSRLGDSLPFPHDMHGRVETSGGLSGSSAESPFAARIYLVGDITRTPGPRPAPQTIPVAIRQGSIAAGNALARIAAEAGSGKNLRTLAYRVRAYPYVLPVGGKRAIVKIGPLVSGGVIAWILKGIIELRYLLSILPFLRALAIWSRGIKIFSTSDRLG